MIKFVLSIRVLGLKWNATFDFFHFDIQMSAVDSSVVYITKRFVLSRIAKLYDLLGWIAPVIVSFRIFMQKLCLNKFDLDVQ